MLETGLAADDASAQTIKRCLIAFNALTSGELGAMESKAVGDLVSEQVGRLHDLVKKKLAVIANSLEVDEVLAITSLVQGDPMLDCVTSMDLRSW